jgi:hypothetical protein
MGSQTGQRAGSGVVRKGSGALTVVVEKNYMMDK